MPSTYPSEIRRQVVELGRAGTAVEQLARTFGMAEATIYNWLKQAKIDRGGQAGVATDQVRRGSGMNAGSVRSATRV